MPENKPQWKPGPYAFEHVTYFAELSGLQAGTFEIGDHGRTDEWLAQTQTIEQAQLFATAPDLYTALEHLVVDFGENGYPTGKWKGPEVTAARAALAKADPQRQEVA